MASLTSLEKRYNRSIKANDFYGAEQAIRMMHHRLTKPKSPGEVDLARALSVLVDAAKTLLQKHQVQAGTALAILAVKHNEDYKVPASQANVAAMIAIADTYELPSDADASAIAEFRREKLRFARAAVQWSARKECLGTQNGSPSLNTVVALAAVDANDFGLAERHFICSDSPKSFAVAMHAYSTQRTLPSEKALLLTRAVLKYLVSENIKDAATFRSAYCSLHGWPSAEAEQVPASTPGAPPLANFCELIIKLCQLESSAAPLFQSVVASYDPELKRDDTLEPMLQKIGARYFGIQPPMPTGLGGMMNTMLKGLMNG
eukprot:GFKZ01006751.1.p2 GENE.GFKZ01006751.1~~GFKZ01006751.1.p2  ORF type:complete len:318 (-),score=42.40 GFKZ01006751.1:1529-2482(-)